MAGRQKSDTPEDLNKFYGVPKRALVLAVILVPVIAALTTAAVIGIFSMSRDISTLKANSINTNERLERIERNIDEKRSEQRTQ